jgi:hypothetical protein
MEESIISLQVGATGAITRGLRERLARVIEGELSDAEVGKHQRARPGAPNSQAAVLVPPRPPAADVVIETTLGPGLGLGRPLSKLADLLIFCCPQSTRTMPSSVCSSPESRT